MFDLKFIEYYLSVFHLLNHLQNMQVEIVARSQVNQILDKSIKKISTYYGDEEDDFKNYQFAILEYFDLYQSFLYYHSRLYKKSNHVFV